MDKSYLQGVQRIPPHLTYLVGEPLSPAPTPSMDTTRSVGASLLVDPWLGESWPIKYRIEKKHEVTIIHPVVDTSAIFES